MKRLGEGWASFSILSQGFSTWTSLGFLTSWWPQGSQIACMMAQASGCKCFKKRQRQSYSSDLALGVMPVSLLPYIISYKQLTDPKRGNTNPTSQWEGCQSSRKICGMGNVIAAIFGNYSLAPLGINQPHLCTISAQYHPPGSRPPSPSSKWK